MMALCSVLQFTDVLLGCLVVLSAIHTSEPWGPNFGTQLGALVSAHKVGLAPVVQHLKQESLKNMPCKPLFSLRFVVDGLVVLRAVVSVVIHSLVPVRSELLLSLPAAKPIESQIPVLGPAGGKCRVSHFHCC